MGDKRKTKEQKRQRKKEKKREARSLSIAYVEKRFQETGKPINDDWQKIAPSVHACIDCGNEQPKLISSTVDKTGESFFLIGCGKCPRGLDENFTVQRSLPEAVAAWNIFNPKPVLP